jgi:ribonuclease HI
MAKIRVFCDGGCSKNGSESAEMGIGVVIEWQGVPPTIVSEYGGFGTNNIAEYTAFNRALELIHRFEIKDVKILSDSNLMVSQINGKWKCKDQGLIPHYTLAKNRIQDLKEKGYNVILEWIPREFNVADTPAKNGYLNR